MGKTISQITKENPSFPWKKFLTNNILFIFLIVLCVVVTIIQPRFIEPQNLTNVLIQVSINAILALGMTFVILTGGIDLSVGSVAALSGVIAAFFIKALETPSLPMSLLVIVGVSLVVGTLFGGINAYAVSWLNVPSFITTLAMMTVARGLAYVFTDGKPIFQLDSSFKWLGQERLFGVIPVLVILVIVLMAVAHIILDKSAFGRHVYAVGSNEEVAHLSGVNSKKVKSIIYIISGVLAALAGVVMASKLGTGQPAAGQSYELTAIAAVVLGGTSMNGGKGSIGKTIIGVLTIGVINNSLNLMHVDSYWQMITMGVIIFAAVVLDMYKEKKKF